MTLVVSIIAIACLIAVIATVVVIARRKSRETVPVQTPPRVVGPARPYIEPLSDLTGPVEIIESVPVPARVAPRAATEPVASSELFDLDREPEREAETLQREIRWAAAFDPRSGALDDTARLRLIGDLGVVAKEWCVPLLSQAYAEELRPANRQAALTALAACRSNAAISTFRRAVAVGDAAERAIAADALNDLEPPAQKKPRTVVERR